MSENYPIRYAAMERGGEGVVIAGKCGVAVGSGRGWKLFGNMQHVRRGRMGREVIGKDGIVNMSVDMSVNMIVNMKVMIVNMSMNMSVNMSVNMVLTLCMIVDMIVDMIVNMIVDMIIL